MNCQNRGPSGSGHGWAGVQIMFWNSEATRWRINAANGAMSWAVGMKGEKGGINREPEPDGILQSLGTFVDPRSLYYSQLKERLGPNALHSVVLPSQKTGDIWTDLDSWAGNGLFGDTVVAWLDEDTVPLAAGNSINIGGMVRDLNLLGSLPTYSWSKTVGTGVATFGDSSMLETTVTFDTADTYTLELQVSDGTLTGTANLDVTVESGAVDP